MEKGKTHGHTKEWRDDEDDDDDDACMHACMVIKVIMLWQVFVEKSYK